MCAQSNFSGVAAGSKGRTTYIQGCSVYTLNPSSGKQRQADSINSRSAWSTTQIPGEPALLTERNPVSKEEGKKKKKSLKSAYVRRGTAGWQGVWTNGWDAVWATVGRDTRMGPV